MSSENANERDTELLRDLRVLGVRLYAEKGKVTRGSKLVGRTIEALQTESSGIRILVARELLLFGKNQIDPATRKTLESAAHRLSSN